LSTRPDGDRDPLVARLREHGHRVHAVPTVATEPLPFEPPDLASYDWLVVTSAAGVAALLANAAPPAGASWAAVGTRTAAALARHGIAVSAVPEEQRGARIAGALAAQGPLAGRRVLLARADAAASDLPDALLAAGAEVHDLAVYHTVAGPESSRAGIADALADPDLAAAIFASGSAVEGLLRLAPHDPRGVPAITIGQVTTAAAAAAGFQVVAEAARPAVEALLDATLRYLQNT
jgi:uroporphyrinogen III methyltransferase/synthase